MIMDFLFFKTTANAFVVFAFKLFLEGSSGGEMFEDFSLSSKTCMCSDIVTLLLRLNLSRAIPFSPFFSDRSEESAEEFCEEFILVSDVIGEVDIARQLAVLFQVSVLLSRYDFGRMRRSLRPKTDFGRNILKTSS